MVSSNLKIELLEERHAIRVLLLLRDIGPVARTAFYPQIAKGMTTVMIRVNQLIDADLIHEDIRNKPPFTKTLRLTDRGRRVAELLARVEEELRRT